MCSQGAAVVSSVIQANSVDYRERPGPWSFLKSALAALVAYNTITRIGCNCGQHNCRRERCHRWCCLFCGCCSCRRSVWIVAHANITIWQLIIILVDCHNLCEGFLRHRCCLNESRNAQHRSGA